MKTTLREAVEQSHVRSGKSNGTTRRGAYWLACDEIVLREAGGDGIGQSGPDITYYLQIRHYRGGEVRAVVHQAARHQNGSWSGAGDWYRAVDLGDCATIEDVVVVLKGGIDFHGGDGRETCYSDCHYADIRDALMPLGLAESAPAPDDVA